LGSVESSYKLLTPKDRNLEKKEVVQMRRKEAAGSESPSSAKSPFSKPPFPSRFLLKQALVACSYKTGLKEEKKVKEERGEKTGYIISNHG